MRTVRWISALMILFAAALTAAPQFPGARQGYGAPPPGFTPLQQRHTPTVTPYLGLLNGGAGNIGLNYYEIYRPQRHFQNLYGNLNNEVGQLRTDVHTFQRSVRQSVKSFKLGPTGHPTMFMDTQGYFPGLGY